MHIYPSRQNFFVLTKVLYLQRFRDFMGGQAKTPVFGTEKRPTGRKNDFFQIFNQNLISLLVQRFHGGTR